MIKKGKINPLELFEVRRVEFCPPYFETQLIETRYNLKQAIESWIEDNLTGRYYIGNSLALGPTSFKSVTKVGFEKSSELSYFMLACPHLKYN